MRRLVVVSNVNGTLALRSNEMFDHKHMDPGSMGVTLGEITEETWFVRVLFPPGVAYDVVKEHLLFLSEEKVK